FKLHFINEKSNDKDYMINYYGVYNFTPSPLNPTSTSVKLAPYTGYNLLSNLTYTTDVEDADMNDDYTFTYKVVKDDKNKTAITVSEAGDATFMSKGTYFVTITA